MFFIAVSSCYGTSSFKGVISSDSVSVEGQVSCEGVFVGDTTTDTTVNRVFVSTDGSTESPASVLSVGGVYNGAIEGLGFDGRYFSSSIYGETRDDGTALLGYFGLVGKCDSNKTPSAIAAIVGIANGSNTYGIFGGGGVDEEPIYIGLYFDGYMSGYALNAVNRDENGGCTKFELKNSQNGNSVIDAVSQGSGIVATFDRDYSDPTYNPVVRINGASDDIILECQKSGSAVFTVGPTGITTLSRVDLTNNAETKINLNGVGQYEQIKTAGGANSPGITIQTNTGDYSGGNIGLIINNHTPLNTDGVKLVSVQNGDSDTDGYPTEEAYITAQGLGWFRGGLSTEGEVFVGGEDLVIEPIGGQVNISSPGMLITSPMIEATGTVEVDSELYVDENLIITKELGGNRYIITGGRQTGLTSSNYFIMGIGGTLAYSSTMGNVMMRPGSITGLSAALNASILTTAGTVEVQVRKNDSPVFSKIISFEATGVKTTWEVQARNTDTFVAGDVLQMYLLFGNFSGTVAGNMMTEVVYDN